VRDLPEELQLEATVLDNYKSRILYGEETIEVSGKTFSDSISRHEKNDYLFSVDLLSQDPLLAGLIGLIVIRAASFVDALNELIANIATSDEELRTIDDFGLLDDFEDDDFTFEKKLSQLKAELDSGKLVAETDFFAYASDNDELLLSN